MVTVAIFRVVIESIIVIVMIMLSRVVLTAGAALVKRVTNETEWVCSSARNGSSDSDQRRPVHDQNLHCQPFVA